MKVIFYISLLLILWHNLIYWIILFSIPLLDKIKTTKSETNYVPFVSFIVAAHNEEKVIEKKIINTLALDYPKEKIEIIFASDNSTDRTNEIITNYSSKYNNIKLLNIKERGGKINVYNHAVKIVSGGVLAFSDANTMLEKDALTKLIQPLNNDNISCTCGHLIYTNKDESETAFSEGLYWKLENLMKERESKLYSLTALNGGIYAIKKDDYIFIDPLYSHDLCFPLLLVRKRKRTVFVKEAIAFEKSATTIEDEVKRKRRMFGRIYSFLFKNPTLFFNPFGYNFIYFIEVFSHRTIRYLLPFLHILLLVSNIYLFPYGTIFGVVLISHLLFLILAVIGYFSGKKNKILFLPYYYITFMKSLFLGFVDFITGKIKPFWDTAKSTRE